MASPITKRPSSPTPFAPAAQPLRAPQSAAAKPAAKALPDAPRGTELLRPLELARPLVHRAAPAAPLPPLGEFAIRASARSVLLAGEASTAVVLTAIRAVQDANATHDRPVVVLRTVDDLKLTAACVRPDGTIDRRAPSLLHEVVTGGGIIVVDYPSFTSSAPASALNSLFDHDPKLSELRCHAKTRIIGLLPPHVSDYNGDFVGRWDQVVPCAVPDFPLPVFQRDVHGALPVCDLADTADWYSALAGRYDFDDGKWCFVPGAILQAYSAGHNGLCVRCPPTDCVTFDIWLDTLRQSERLRVNNTVVRLPPGFTIVTQLSPINTGELARAHAGRWLAEPPPGRKVVTVTAGSVHRLFPHRDIDAKGGFPMFEGMLRDDVHVRVASDLSHADWHKLMTHAGRFTWSTTADVSVPSSFGLAPPAQALSVAARRGFALPPDLWPAPGQNATFVSTYDVDMTTEQLQRQCPDSVVFDVTHQSVASLCRSYTPTTEGKFERHEGPLFAALRAGRPIVIRGLEHNPRMRLVLQSALHAPNHLFEAGHCLALPAAQIIVVEDTPHACSTSHHAFIQTEPAPAESEQWVAIAAELTTTTPDTIHQVLSFHRALKTREHELRVTRAGESVTSPLPEHLTVAALRRLLRFPSLRVGLDALYVAGLPWADATSKALRTLLQTSFPGEAAALPPGIQARSLALLTTTHALFLQGPTGAGKSTLATELARALDVAHTFRLTISPTTSIEELRGPTGPLTQWRSCTAKALLIVDEANLVSHPFWRILKDALAQPNLFVIFTGNDPDSPGRHTCDFVRDIFATVRVPRLSSQVLADSVLTRAVDTYQPRLSAEGQALLVRLHELARQHMRDGFVLSPRDVQEVVLQLALWQQGTTEPCTNSDIVAATARVYGSLLSPTGQAVWLMVSHHFDGPAASADRRLAGETTQYERFIASTPFAPTQANRTMFASLCDLRDRARFAAAHSTAASSGKCGLYIEGPPATGKDTFTETFLRHSGLPYRRVTAGPDTAELARIVEDCRRTGTILILSEANLLPSSVLEALVNPAADAGSAPGFAFIFTCNDSTYVGRERFSAALANRLRYCKLPTTDNRELRRILRGATSDEALATAILRRHKAMRLTGHNPTPREALRAVRLAGEGLPIADAVRQSYAFATIGSKAGTGELSASQQDVVATAARVFSEWLGSPADRVVGRAPSSLTPAGGGGSFGAASAARAAAALPRSVPPRPPIRAFTSALLMTAPPPQAGAAVGPVSRMTGVRSDGQPFFVGHMYSSAEAWDTCHDFDYAAAVEWRRDLAIVRALTDPQATSTVTLENPETSSCRVDGARREAVHLPTGIGDVITAVTIQGVDHLPDLASDQSGRMWVSVDESVDLSAITYQFISPTNAPIPEPLWASLREMQTTPSAEFDAFPAYTCVVDRFAEDFRAKTTLQDQNACLQAFAAWFRTNFRYSLEPSVREQYEAARRASTSRIAAILQAGAGCCSESAALFAATLRSRFQLVTLVVSGAEVKGTPHALVRCYLHHNATLELDPTFGGEGSVVPNTWQTTMLEPPAPIEYRVAADAAPLPPPLELLAIPEAGRAIAVALRPVPRWISEHRRAFARCLQWPKEFVRTPMPLGGGFGHAPEGPLALAKIMEGSRDIFAAPAVRATSTKKTIVFDASFKDALFDRRLQRDNLLTAIEREFLEVLFAEFPVRLVCGETLTTVTSAEALLEMLPLATPNAVAMPSDTYVLTYKAYQRFRSQWMQTHPCLSRIKHSGSDGSPSQYLLQRFAFLGGLPHIVHKTLERDTGLSFLTFDRVEDFHRLFGAWDDAAHEAAIAAALGRLHDNTEAHETAFRELLDSITLAATASVRRGECNVTRTYHQLAEHFATGTFRDAHDDDDYDDDYDYDGPPTMERSTIYNVLGPTLDALVRIIEEMSAQGRLSASSAAEQLNWVADTFVKRFSPTLGHGPITSRAVWIALTASALRCDDDTIFMTLYDPLMLGLLEEGLADECRAASKRALAIYKTITPTSSMVDSVYETVAVLRFLTHDSSIGSEELARFAHVVPQYSAAFTWLSSSRLVELMRASIPGEYLAEITQPSSFFGLETRLAEYLSPAQILAMTAAWTPSSHLTHLKEVLSKISGDYMTRGVVENLLRAVQAMQASGKWSAIASELATAESTLTAVRRARPVDELPEIGEETIFGTCLDTLRRCT